MRAFFERICGPRCVEVIAKYSARRGAALTYLFLIVAVAFLAFATEHAHKASRSAREAATTAKALSKETRAIVVKNRELTLQNQAAIAYIDQFRRQQEYETARADVRLCQAINLITKRDRATIVNGPKLTPLLLNLLGIPPDVIAKYVGAQQKAAIREVFKRPFVKCKRLPSQPK